MSSDLGLVIVFNIIIQVHFVRMVYITLALIKPVEYSDFIVLTLKQVLDATDNEPWGPHGTALAEIAQATKRL